MKRFVLGQGQFAESLLGRIALVALYVVTWSLALVLLFLLLPQFNPIVLKYLVLTLIGLGTGLLARRLLAGHTRALIFSSSLLAEILALSLLSPITYGFLGMDTLGYFPASPNAEGILQLAVVAVNGWLVLMAWSGRVSVEPESRTRVGKPGPVLRPAPRPPNSKSPLRTLRVAARRRLDAISTSVRSVLAAPGRLLDRGNGRLRVRKPSRRRKPIWGRSALRLGANRRNGVQLSQVVEHRCPYCLDLVEPNDKRGVKVCQVCKTPHHADCWEVAGVCQVPHEVI